MPSTPARTPVGSTSPRWSIVSRRDRLIWADRQRELADAIPGGKSIELDVAHNGWLVKPDTVCDAIETAVDMVCERLSPHQEALGRPV